MTAVICGNLFAGERIFDRRLDLVKADLVAEKLQVMINLGFAVIRLAWRSSSCAI